MARRILALVVALLIAASPGLVSSTAATASETDCLNFGYSCTPGYTGNNASSTWAWKYYGGSYASTANGYHNCTLYAAWRLMQNGEADPGRSWGNAVDWANAIGGNHSPAVGSIAWWGSERGSGYGHVAYVEQVTGDQVYLLADNYSTANGYTDSGWTNASSVDLFLHPHDLPAGSGDSPPTRNGGSVIHGTGSGRCIDVQSASFTDGARPQLYDCLNNAQQQWIFNSGQLQVYGNYGKCFDADSRTGGINGTAVQIWSCNGGSNQQWTFRPDGTVRSGMSGRCLDAAGTGTANGTQLQLWDCTGASNQAWTGGPAPNGGATLNGVGSNRCIDIPGAAISPGTRPQLYDCNLNAQQQWLLAGSQLQVYGDKCLDVQGAGTANGTPVQIWYCSGAIQQQWALRTDGSIQSQQSGRCLDAIGAGTANGTQLQIWDCSGAVQQQWSHV